MPVLEMYNKARDRFPEVTGLADKEHLRNWGEPDPEFAYSWFESLANAINKQMVKGTSPQEYTGVFQFLSSEYSEGDSEARNCIDVAFTENLFWQVSPEQAAPYWSMLPANLKDLYIGFHRKPPL